MYFDSVFFFSYSKRRCSVGSRFCTQLSVMGRRCWSKVRWMTGKKRPSFHLFLFKLCYPLPTHLSISALSRPCRDEFNLKLALLSNQWQGVVRRAQQRRGIIDSLIRQWQRYREMVEKLRRWLVEISHPAEALQAGATVPLQQARSMLDALQVPVK